MDNKIFGRVDEYISDLLAPEDEALVNTIRSLQVQNIPQASVSANQGKLLQVFALMCGAQNILELGTLGGYSSIWLARALPGNGKVLSIESEQKHALIAAENIAAAGLSDKVEIRTGAALDVLRQIAGEQRPPFDMIFIDADKPPYTEYFQWAIRLGRPGTIIVADNVIRNGKVLDRNSADEKVKGVQRLNSFLSQCAQVSATILQTVGIKEHDGMVVAVIKPE